MKMGTAESFKFLLIILIILGYLNIIIRNENSQNLDYVNIRFLHVLKRNIIKRNITLTKFVSKNSSSHSNFDKIKFCDKNFFHDDILLPKEAKEAEKAKKDVKSENPESLDASDEKYLFSINTYGPNNQIKSFFSTLYTAMVLNRTFVVNTMYRHGTDENTKDLEDPYVPVSLRLDLKSIIDYFKNKIKITDSETALKNCNYTYDTAMVLKTQKDVKQRHFFSKFYQVPLPSNIKMSQYSNIKKLFEYYDNFSLTLKSDEDILKYLDADGEYDNFLDIRKLADQKDQEDLDPLTNINYRNKKCAVLMMPLHHIDEPSKKIYNYELLKFPEHIYDIIKDFYGYRFGHEHDQTSKHASNHASNSYDLGIHWRYNDLDWGKRCRIDGQPKLSIKEEDVIQCKLVNSSMAKNGKFLSPKILANLLKNWAKKLNIQNPKIYIATPPTEYKFIEKVEHLLNQEEYPQEESHNLTFQIDYGKNLENYFSETWPNRCKIQEDYSSEISSLLEQAILEKVGVFFYWPRSTWSDRVTMLRGFRSQNQGKSNLNLDIIDELLSNNGS